MDGVSTTAMTRDQVSAFLDEVFPQIHTNGRIFGVESVGPMTATMRCRYDPRHIRPGGTISGPTMMALADLSLYVAILAQIGPVALAVTTNLSFNFLRKPEPADLIGTCRLMKVGKRLAMGEVTITSQGTADPVCHATGTYSIPSR